MRWEKELGMPVERVPGSKRSRVYGSRAKISQWLTSNLKAEQPPEVAVTQGEPSPKPALRRIGITVIGLMALVLTGGGIVMNFTPPKRLPSQVKFGDEAIEALDSQGRRLWTYRFGKRLGPFVLDTKALTEFVRIDDFRGDGNREILVVAPFRTGSNPEDPQQVDVDCFSADGKLLWSHTPRQTFRFGEYEIGPPWFPEAVFVSSGPRHTIWVSFSHQEWGNSYVANLDPATGQETVRYVNTGTIRSVSELRTRHATYLLVGGFNNEWDGPSLAMIDERKGFTVSPQTAGTRHKCVSCSGGSPPDYYIVLPRSELDKAAMVGEDSVAEIYVADGKFTLIPYEMGMSNRSVQTLVEFQVSPDVLPISLRYCTAYDMLHREFELSHKLNHGLKSCPERLHPPPIRMWTPKAGWTDVRLPSRSFVE
jgi:hypothetical protein